MTNEASKKILSRFVDTRGAAKLIGVSRQRVQQYVAAGRLEALGTLGRSHIFARDAIERFAAQRAWAQ